MEKQTHKNESNQVLRFDQSNGDEVILGPGDSGKLEVNDYTIALVAQNMLSTVESRKEAKENSEPTNSNN